MPPKRKTPKLKLLVTESRPISWERRTDEEVTAVVIGNVLGWGHPKTELGASVFREIEPLPGGKVRLVRTALSVTGAWYNFRAEYDPYVYESLESLKRHFMIDGMLAELEKNGFFDDEFEYSFEPSFEPKFVCQLSDTERQERAESAREALKKWVARHNERLEAEANSWNHHEEVHNNLSERPSENDHEMQVDI